VQEDGDQYTRGKLLEDRLKAIEPDDYDLDDDEEADEFREDVFGEFLNESVDVRYFGATMSVDTDEVYAKHLPDHFTGPVQFSPGKSMHAVNENEEYDSLTSVIATQENKQQGGFDLDDHRIQYGLIRFHGLVDEHGAADTNLTAADVKRLDTLCWRAIKNQTISRSKVGQEPRLYCRVEYADESFHLGGLDRDLELDDEHSKPDEELRTVRDLTLNVTELVDRLGRASDRIDRVRFVASDVLQLNYDGELGGPALLHDALEDALGANAVEQIKIYDEQTATLPSNDDMA
jgi:CRISPR-associated protein Csh2